MALVIIRNTDYVYRTLNNTVKGILDRILGNQSLISKKVIIKPNLLSAAPPQRAITTHPAIIRAVAEYLLENRATVTISDSPAIGSFNKILHECGISEAMRGLSVTFCEFKASRSVPVKAPFHKIDLSCDALDADLIVNLPKLKTHAQMLLTLGVKNLFGCVVGMKKPRWHLRTGVDRDLFARLLIEIYLALKPSVTLLDGILAMEGQGPGKRGSARFLGILAGSEDAISLDFAVARILSIDPLSVPVNSVAHDLNLGGSVEVDGDFKEVTDFILPDIVDLLFGPPYLHGFMRKHLIQRPVVENETCQLCLECIKHCPVNAIQSLDSSLKFNYDKCIRCYCCIEICPHGAMRTKQPYLGKILKKMKN